ncbi:MAG: c-type cytochrome [Reyranella sp.]|uniref:c-type cytochrome n=1 Tax=Reyranella sp. TaxID=1929291 RepID=UPI001AD2516B|nr:c-type cytochrome [Reyranella sp.]MBN9088638.1 c-type cytochrome [Reyranella sp.]
MTLKGFAAAFLAVCCAIAAGTLATYRPAAVATAADDLVGYGKRLVTETFAEIGPDTGKPFAGNRLACQSRHLDAGTRPSGVPLVGVAKAYPKFSARSGRVISLAERIDECMTRSMNGTTLPQDSREMAAFIAYIRSLDGPAVVQAPPAPTPSTPPDAARGAEVHTRVCAACHQPDGLGRRAGRGYEFPPLWGPDSFNDGAGMDRFERAVGFIQRNMPRGIDPAHPQLTLQEAWDVAALLQSKPRPRYAGR